jgi:putative ABC transport system permease protein
MTLHTIFRQVWRHALRRPLQSLFFVLGVAIGVAMIVAIDLANGSAQRAFELGAESVAGRATHQINGGPQGIDEAVYTDLRREMGYRLSAPVVESYVIAETLDVQPMRLLGVDPFAEGPFRAYLGLGDQSRNPAADYLAELMATPNTALLSQVVAERYGVKTGDVLSVRDGVAEHLLTVVGLLQPSDALSRRALDGLLLTDIATAQEILGKVGRLDRIDLIIAEGEEGEAELTRLRQWLPAGVALDVATSRGGTVDDMTAAFRLNLSALSLLALVVGMFLIYNTVTFGVVQRRPVLGALRALGMTRREIYALILLEAGVLGLIGSALGLALGVLLGRGAVQLVTQTVNDLFFVVSVREIDIPTMTLVKGGIIGVAAALVGAALPAYEATSTPPAGALRRSSVEDRARRLLPWLTAGGVGLLLAGGLLMIPDASLVIAFGGLFALIIGAAFCTPVLLLGMMMLVQSVLHGSGVIARMAPRTVTRSLSRTAVAVAALMVAVSVIIGVGVMIGSFRVTVVRWLDDVLQADIFVSPPSLQSNQITTTLDPQVVERLRQFPGVVRLATTRGVDMTARLPGRDQPIQTRLVALSQDLAGDDRRYHAAVGDAAETWRAVEQGGVVVNEPMANRYDLAVGDPLALMSDHGPVEFPIVGVSVDFNVNPTVTMHDPVYRRHWQDEGISAVGLFIEPGQDVDDKVAELRAAFAGTNELVVRSNRGVRGDALAVFDRTFAITVALQLLATLVAFIGILSTLMSLQLERTREIGVLRANGMTRRQLWRLSLLETGLMGVSAGILALPTGVLLAVVLIYIINLRSFGWTLEMQLQPQTFVQAFAVALFAALLAGLYPAWRLGQMQPAAAVRAE